MIWLAVGVALLLLVAAWAAWLVVRRPRGAEPAPLEGSAPREAVRAVMDRHER